MAVCSSNALLDNSTQFQALDNRQLYIVIAQLLCEWLKSNNPMAQCDAASLLQGACNSKIDCLQNRELWVVIAQLLCEILQSGGGSGTSCLLCGAVDPVAAPACTCAIYYNTANSSFWVWDNGAVVWQPLIQ